MSKDRGKRKNTKMLRTLRMNLFAKNNICSLCKKEIIDLEESSIDHIIPLSKGGSNEHSNLALAHVKCNNLKGSKPYRRWKPKNKKEKYVEPLKVSIEDLIKK